MGIFVSLESKNSKRIDKELHKDNENDKTITKLLLLGETILKNFMHVFFLIYFIKVFHKCYIGILK